MLWKWILYWLLCRKYDGAPRIRDEVEIQRQTEAKQAEIQAYRSYREEVERKREADRQARNAAKLKQIQLCELMQVANLQYYQNS